MPIHLLTGHTGNEHITAAEDAIVNRAIIGNSDLYVFDHGNNFRSEKISEQKIRIYDGVALAQGRKYILSDNSFEEVNISAGAEGKNRVDFICIRYFRNSLGVETSSIYVVEGSLTNIGNIQEPETYRGDVNSGDINVRDYKLYRVYVRNLAIDTITPMFTVSSGIANATNAGSDSIAEALRIAIEAHDTATESEGTATTALQTANNAQAGIISAQQTANNAFTTAQSALSTAQSADTKASGLQAQITANTNAINTLNGNVSTPGSVAKSVADGIADAIAGAPASFDTLKEISDWIADHPEDTTAMNTAIQANTRNISDHISDKTNPHEVTKAQVGLENVGNFKAVSTEANQGLTTAEKQAARDNIGAGSSSFSGSYNDLTDKPTIPTVNDGILTITSGGNTIGTFSANSSNNVTVNIPSGGGGGTADGSHIIVDDLPDYPPTAGFNPKAVYSLNSEVEPSELMVTASDVEEFIESGHRTTSSSDNTADKILDGSTANMDSWMYRGVPGYVGVKLKSKKLVKRAVIRIMYDGCGQNNAGQLQGSNDGQNWNVVGEYDEVKTVREINVNMTEFAQYLYYRVYITVSAYNDGLYSNVNELYLYYDALSAPTYKYNFINNQWQTVINDEKPVIFVDQLPTPVRIDDEYVLRNTGESYVFDYEDTCDWIKSSAGASPYTFDTVPKKSSKNPVTSNGIYTQIPTAVYSMTTSGWKKVARLSHNYIGNFYFILGSEFCAIVDVIVSSGSGIVLRANASIDVSNRIRINRVSQEETYLELNKLNSDSQKFTVKNVGRQLTYTGSQVDGFELYDSMTESEATGTYTYPT